MNNKITFMVVFLIVTTLLLSAFAVAQQAQVRRMPTGMDKTRIQWDGSKNTGIQRDSLKSTGMQMMGRKSASAKLQEGPVAKPKPSPVAIAKANKNAAFKRSGAVTQSGTETKGMIDPSFKPTERRGIIVPDFKPRNNARVTGAVGLESSVKQSPAKKGTKRVPTVNITPIAKRGVGEKGIIVHNEEKSIIDPTY